MNFLFSRRTSNKTKKNKKKSNNPAEEKNEVKARAMEEEEMKPVVETEKKENVEKAQKTSKTKKNSNKRKTSTKKQPSATSTPQKKNSDHIKKAKATLFGLSSLKRVGNVKVTPGNDFTSVKSNFVLGPLMLRVEKGSEEKRDIKMATATTHEIYGRINLRVVNGQASLHSIKVQQPKQVKVDSEDNMPSSRQIWTRNSNIVKVVAKKLRSAVKSSLAPAA